jgi:hypothetical protein
VTISDGLAGSDVEVAGDGDAARGGPVVTSAADSGRGGGASAGVGGGVLGGGAFAQFRVAFGGVLAVAQPGRRRLAGVEVMLRPVLLTVQRAQPDRQDRRPALRPPAPASRRPGPGTCPPDSSRPGDARARRDTGGTRPALPAGRRRM